MGAVSSIESAAMVDGEETDEVAEGVFDAGSI